MRNVDLSAYGRSFALLVRFPQVMVGPLLAGILQFVVISSLASASGPTGLDTLAAYIYQFIGLLIQAVGFALALIVADDAWRRDRAPLSDAWNDASRKIGSIFFAALGVQFISYIATVIGGMLGTLVGSILGLLAYFFLIYTMPAAAIGGIPGGAPALEASVSRARANPIPTLIIAILSFAVTTVVPGMIVSVILPLIFVTSIFNNSVVTGLVVAGVSSVLTGYLAFVLAKVYADLSYGRRW